MKIRCTGFSLKSKIVRWCWSFFKGITFQVNMQNLPVTRAKAPPTAPSGDRWPRQVLRPGSHLSQAVLEASLSSAQVGVTDMHIRARAGVSFLHQAAHPLRSRRGSHWVPPWLRLPEALPCWRADPGVDISILLSDKSVHWLVKKSILFFPGSLSTGELMDRHGSPHSRLQFCSQFVSLASGLSMWSYLQWTTPKECPWPCPLAITSTVTECRPGWKDGVCISQDLRTRDEVLWGQVDEGSMVSSVAGDPVHFPRTCA